MSWLFCCSNTQTQKEQNSTVDLSKPIIQPSKISQGNQKEFEGLSGQINEDQKRLNEILVNKQMHQYNKDEEINPFQISQEYQNNNQGRNQSKNRTMNDKRLNNYLSQAQKLIQDKQNKVEEIKQKNDFNLFDTQEKITNTYRILTQQSKDSQPLKNEKKSFQKKDSRINQSYLQSWSTKNENTKQIEFKNSQQKQEIENNQQKSRQSDILQSGKQKMYNTEQNQQIMDKKRNSKLQQEAQNNKQKQNSSKNQQNDTDQSDQFYPSQSSEFYYQPKYFKPNNNSMHQKVDNEIQNKHEDKEEQLTQGYSGSSTIISNSRNPSIIPQSNNLIKKNFNNVQTKKMF